jgi:hypothetical protein
MMGRRAFLGLCLAASPAAGVGRAFASDGGVGAGALFFSHATVFVSPATYREIVSCTFLRDEFAALDEQTTALNGGKLRYSGAFVQGARTYLEFMQPGERGTLGEVRLGLWANRQSQLDPLLSRLAKLPGGKPFVGQTTDPIGGVEVPWFKFVRVEWDHPRPRIEPWAMSVFPGYLKARHPDLTAAEDGQTREKQYARSYDPHRLLGDIDRIVVSTSATEAAALAAELDAFGLPGRRTAEGQSFDAQDVTIIVADAPAAAHTVSWHMHLNRNTPRESITLGDSLLVLDGRSAEWAFRG